MSRNTIQMIVAFFLAFFFVNSLQAEEWHEEFECMVVNMLFESRGEGEEGMRAVAHVTWNRVKSDKYPNNVCSVVYQPKQFSWTDQQEEMVELRPSVEEEVIHRARVIASHVMTGVDMNDPTDGALFYHADFVMPYWRTGLMMTATIGAHIFYRPGGEQLIRAPLD